MRRSLDLLCNSLWRPKAMDLPVGSVKRMLTYSMRVGDMRAAELPQASHGQRRGFGPKWSYARGLLLLALLLFASVASAEPITCAAFDLGSGKFKLLIAEYDSEKPQGSEIELKWSETIAVRLGNDLAESPDHLFSEKIQKAAFEAISELQERAQAHGATRFFGLATAAFRAAHNGQKLLDEIIRKSGIELSIISQSKEGELGFESVMHFYPHFKRASTIVVDLGGASFQLTTKEGESYRVFEGPLGSSKVAKIFCERVRKKPFHADEHFKLPEIEEAALLIEELKKEIPKDDLLTSLVAAQGDVVVLVSDEGIFARLRERPREMDRSDIWKMLESVTTEEVSYPELASLDYIGKRGAIYTLSLLSAIMQHFGVEKIHIAITSGGSAVGLIKEKFR